MTSKSNAFLKPPQTRLGWWSVGLSLLFAVLFLGILNELIRFSGFLTMMLGLAGSVVTLLALILKRERSWLVWLMLLPALFTIVFTVAELLYPH